MALIHPSRCGLCSCLAHLTAPDQVFWFQSRSFRGPESAAQITFQDWTELVRNHRKYCSSTSPRPCNTAGDFNCPFWRPLVNCAINWMEAFSVDHWLLQHHSTSSLDAKMTMCLFFFSSPPSSKLHLKTAGGHVSFALLPPEWINYPAMAVGHRIRC